MKEVFIYTKRSNSRIEYVFNHMFSEMYGIRPLFVEDPKNILPDCLIIEYGIEKEIEESVFIGMDPVILSDTFVERDPLSIYENDTLAFFPIKNEQSVLPFDLICLVFFFLSRIEETYKTKEDRFSRFSSFDSILKQYDALLFPIVDHWIQHFVTDKLKLDIIKSYQFFPSFDIDHAWKYKNRGFLLSFGSLINSFLRLDFNDISTRLKVVFGNQKDPFNTFDEILQLLANSNVKSIFFFLLGGKKKYDRNISPNNIAFRALIHKISKTHFIGIHPSFYSSELPGLIEKEVLSLNKILMKDVIHSRQHYLKFNLNTLKTILGAGIKHEYSMGFHDHVGFRAGTGQEYKWYDLENEQTTDLTIHPLIAMDISLKNHMGLSQSDATEICHILREVCKKYKLTFHLLMHNNTFSDKGDYIGWSKTFRKILNDMI